MKLNFFSIKLAIDSHNVHFLKNASIIELFTVYTDIIKELSLTLIQRTL